jgi:hypothetical protein
MYQEELEYRVDMQQTLWAGGKFSHGNVLTIEIDIPLYQADFEHWRDLQQKRCGLVFTFSSRIASFQPLLGRRPKSQLIGRNQLQP